MRAKEPQEGPDLGFLIRPNVEWRIVNMILSLIPEGAPPARAHTRLGPSGEELRKQSHSLSQRVL